MNIFHSVKLRTKLVGSFLMVSLVVLFLGGFGVVKLKQVNEADALLYKEATLPLAEIGDISTTLQRLRLNLLELVNADSPESLEFSKKQVATFREAITTKMSLFAKHSLSADEQKLLDDMRAALAKWISTNGHVTTYVIDGVNRTFASAADLQQRISWLEKEVAREEAAARIAAGLGTGRRVQVRF